MFFAKICCDRKFYIAVVVTKEGLQNRKVYIVVYSVDKENNLIKPIGGKNKMTYEIKPGVIKQTKIIV